MPDYPVDVISSRVEGDEMVEIIITHKPGVDECTERRSPKPADPEPAPEQPTNAEIMTKLNEVLAAIGTVQTSTETMAADVAAVKEVSLSGSIGTAEKVA